MIQDRGFPGFGDLRVRMVDASHEKGAKAKETIQQLVIEIANLTRLVEQGILVFIHHHTS